MALSIMTLSILDLFVTFFINIQHNDAGHKSIE
jgi:hypothetical protein